jgi:hypothetical protein
MFRFSFCHDKHEFCISSSYKQSRRTSQIRAAPTIPNDQSMHINMADTAVTEKKAKKLAKFDALLQSMKHRFKSSSKRIKSSSKRIKTLAPFNIIKKQDSFTLPEIKLIDAYQKVHPIDHDQVVEDETYSYGHESSSEELSDVEDYEEIEFSSSDEEYWEERSVDSDDISWIEEEIIERTVDSDDISWIEEEIIE